MRRHLTDRPGVGERHSCNNNQQRELKLTWTHFLCNARWQNR